MTPEGFSAIVSASGVVLSLLGSAYISGRRDGRMDVRVAMLEASQEKLATREQLAGVKEDVAEIKGMFRMTLRDGTTGVN